MHLTAMTLDNSKPRYLQQVFISFRCSRYRGSTVLIQTGPPHMTSYSIVEGQNKLLFLSLLPD